MKRLLLAAAVAAATGPARADHAENAPVVGGAGIVTVTGARQGTLPGTLPSTIEGIDAAEIAERINATDAQDALKYLPSLLVRKRYPGDFNHAVLSSRASGTGNSARSVVYADGILLSNFLGNGATFAPRWGLVSPEEIDRVDVLYGPFSAAYAGNSVGAVVDVVTKMPTRFEAHGRAGVFVQPFRLYGSGETFGGWHASAALGSREGPWSWRVSLSRVDSEAQPLTFATKQATTATAGTPVDGAVAGIDRFGQPWWIVGDATRYRTEQDTAKLKLGYDWSPALKAQALLAQWSNRATAQARSYLTRAADGTPFFSGTARIGGANYAVTAGDFPQSREKLEHRMAGFTLRRRNGGAFDWDIAASTYRYATDLVRAATTPKPAADSGGAGRLTDLAGTGWTTLAAHALWRASATHRVDVGVQQENYRWRQRVDNATDWIGGAPTTPVNAFRGNTRLLSLWGQDAWTLDADWTAVLGLRHETWTAWGGERSNGAAAPAAFAPRREQWLSPKAAIGWQAGEDWGLKLATGRAVRAPTVGELFQGNGGNDPVSNPALRPEKSWTTELSWERSEHHDRLRATLFHEDTRDALYSQAIPGTTPLASSVQNVDRIRTWGAELVAEQRDALVKGLDLQGSLTYADSTIVENTGFVAVPGDTVGKQQPRVPRWRAAASATWRASDALALTYSLRYGGRQYGTLNNADTHGSAYFGFSRFFSTDLRALWKIDARWSAAFGIDNLNNATYWNFHPYPQRAYHAELRFDL